MTDISDDQLLEFNRQGFVPGPGEADASFLDRVRRCLHFSNNLSEYLKRESFDFPFKEADIVPIEVRHKAISKAAQAFDVDPQWVPAFYSNKGLAPWHGGGAWIFSDDEGPLALFQLRESFRYSPRYLGLYDVDEIFAHEAVHVGRMAFEEPRYEEIFAYKTAKSKVRQWLGPLVQSSTEALVFVCVILVLTMLDVWLLFSDSLSILSFALWLKLVPVGMICFALLRLAFLKRALARSLKRLREIVIKPSAVLPVAYRLTDKEIGSFSSMSAKEISAYALRDKGRSLRWRLLCLAYLKP